MGNDKDSDGVSNCEVEDLIHNFLIVMLEHSMRQKDGWKVRYFDPLFPFRKWHITRLPLSVFLPSPSSYCFFDMETWLQLYNYCKVVIFQDVEAAIHCAEWLSMVGGSSTGDQRIR
jgi:hypothetical protein